MDNQCQICRSAEAVVRMRGISTNSDSSLQLCLDCAAEQHDRFLRIQFKKTAWLIITELLGD